MTAQPGSKLSDALLGAAVGGYPRHPDAIISFNVVPPALPEHTYGRVELIYGLGNHNELHAIKYA